MSNISNHPLPVAPAQTRKPPTLGLAATLDFKIDKAPSYYSKDVASSTRTVNKSELKLMEVNRLHAVVFTNKFFDSVVEAASKQIPNLESILQKETGYEEWLSHLQLDCSSRNLAPFVASEADCVQWFKAVLVKSALTVQIAARKKTIESSTSGLEDLYFSSVAHADGTCHPDLYRCGINVDVKLKGEDLYTVPDGGLVKIEDGEHKIVCSAEIKTDNSLPTHIFDLGFKQDDDDLPLAVPFSWPVQGKTLTAQTKILVQVYCQMISRGVSYAVLSSYNTTFFFYLIETKRTIGSDMNVMCVAGPFIINRRDEENGEEGEEDGEDEEEDEEDGEEDEEDEEEDEEDEEEDGEDGEEDEEDGEEDEEEDEEDEEDEKKDGENGEYRNDMSVGKLFCWFDRALQSKGANVPTLRKVNMECYKTWKAKNPTGIAKDRPKLEAGLQIAHAREFNMLSLQMKNSKGEPAASDKKKSSRK